MVLVKEATKAVDEFQPLIFIIDWLRLSRYI
jgi:hypothetical protein